MVESKSKLEQLQKSLEHKIQIADNKGAVCRVLDQTYAAERALYYVRDFVVEVINNDFSANSIRDIYDEILKVCNLFERLSDDAWDKFDDMEG